VCDTVLPGRLLWGLMGVSAVLRGYFGVVAASVVFATNGCRAGVVRRIVTR